MSESKQQFIDRQSKGLLACLMQRVFLLVLVVTSFTVMPASAQEQAADAPCDGVAAAADCCDGAPPSIECPITDCASSGAAALVACARDVRPSPLSAGHDTILDRRIAPPARAPDTAPPKPVV